MGLVASAAGCCLDDPDQLRACSTNTRQTIQEQKEQNPPNFCGEVGRNGRVKGGGVWYRWRCGGGSGEESSRKRTGEGERLPKGPVLMVPDVLATSTTRLGPRIDDPDIKQSVIYSHKFGASVAGTVARPAVATDHFNQCGIHKHINNPNRHCGKIYMTLFSPNQACLQRQTSANIGCSRRFNRRFAGGA